MEAKYLGKTGIYEGKLFIHGRIYNLIYVGYDHLKDWLWYNIDGILISYTKQGFQEIWKIV